MVGEILVKEIGRHQLQDGVAQELHPLVGALGQIGEAQGAVRERSRQKTNVSKFRSGLLLKFGQFLKE